MSGTILSCNTSNVVYGRIRMPRVGLWDAQLKLDTSTSFAQGQSVTIATASDPTTFSVVGTVMQAGVFDGVTQVRAIGGGGGLSIVVPAKSYQGATVKMVLSDLLAAVGEKLSPTSDTGAMRTVLKFWSRTAGRANVAFYRVLEELPGIAWRALPDGTIWVGTETYPAAPTKISLTLRERWFGEGRAVVSAQYPFLLPGYTVALPGFTGVPQRMSVVAHELYKDDYRADLLFE